MNFIDIAKNRQSCRNYDSTKSVEQEKIDAILQAARLAPSACNSQPYHITVCKGEKAKQLALAAQKTGLNKFARDANVMLVISEKSQGVTASRAAKLMDNDYRSIDIGIVSAYITAQATAQGLGTCIIGWFDENKAKQICGIKDKIRLIITLGYANRSDSLRNKSRKSLDELVTTIGEYDVQG